jgi:hypothetical protein
MHKIRFLPKTKVTQKIWHFCLRDYLGTETINGNVTKENSIWSKLIITKIIENFDNIREILWKSEKFGIVETLISRKRMNKSVRILYKTSWFYIINLRSVSINVNNQDIQERSSIIDRARDLWPVTSSAISSSILQWQRCHFPALSLFRFFP